MGAWTEREARDALWRLQVFCSKQPLRALSWTPPRLRMGTEKGAALLWRQAWEQTEVRLSGALEAPPHTVTSSDCPAVSPNSIKEAEPPGPRAAHRGAAGWVGTSANGKQAAMPSHSHTSLLINSSSSLSYLRRRRGGAGGKCPVPYRRLLGSRWASSSKGLVIRLSLFSSHPHPQGGLEMKDFFNLLFCFFKNKSVKPHLACAFLHIRDTRLPVCS